MNTKEKLNANALQFCKEFLSNGEYNEVLNLWRAGGILNPVCDKKGFVVNCDNGIWYDNQTHTHGSLIEIIQKQNNCGFFKALKIAKKWLKTKSKNQNKASVSLVLIIGRSF